MRRKWAVLIALGILTAVPTTPASADTVVQVPPDVSDDPPALGLTCGLVSTTDQQDPERQTGIVYGGPLVATDPLATIQMTCTIQVGWMNTTHSGVDSCVAMSQPTVQVTVLPPSLCSYPYREDEPISLCTQVEVGGQVHYWDPTATGGVLDLPGAWSTSPDVPCVEVPPPS